MKVDLVKLLQKLYTHVEQNMPKSCGMCGHPDACCDSDCVGAAHDSNTLAEIRQAIKSIEAERDTRGRLVNAAKEAVDLMDAAASGEYIMDSFSSQPLRMALNTERVHPPACSECGGTGVVNTFDGKDTGSNTADNWSGLCPNCSQG